MKLFLKNSVWPVVAGLLVAFVIMMLFEFTNSRLYPFPAGFDVKDLNALKAFTRTLPPFAFIMVLLGWTGGSWVAGVVVSKMTPNNRIGARNLTFVVGGLLTFFGLLNNFIFLPGIQPLWFVLAGIPTFLACSYAGHRYIYC